MSDVSLRADCARCAALCCVSLAFDRSDLFAFDKAAGVPCPHLQNHACSIHRDREQLGFAGCVGYDCLGAGQRVTQQVFDGRSWRDNPALTEPMIDAFRAMRLVHALLQLLQTAETLSLSFDQERSRLLLLAVLQPIEGWSRQNLGAFERGPTPLAIRTFLKALQGQIPPHQALDQRTPVTLAAQFKEPSEQ
jgi:hypothetical protein